MLQRTLRHLSATACLLLALAAPAHAGPDTYALDPVHTRVLVAVDHAGFSSALGTLSGATGTLVFDPDDWSSARVEVEIPVARLDFGDEAWNRATLARNLLDTDTHPTASFVSTRVVPVDARRAIIHGLLTLRGSSREVALEVVLNSVRRHPLPPFRRTVGFSAATTLSRSDFGVSAWKSMIGDVVTLRIEAEATRSRAEADTDTDTDDTPSADPAAQSEAESSPTPDPEPLP
ncbi:MAG TPA: YceI family protein [Luteimonas sp.]|nr:YceI family protein [Luteimonas sp.]HRO27133.1 YceI family protein [Luteimonas sp.]HRP71867.1 YceI family protein [Luteimonas sp.]